MLNITSDPTNNEASFEAMPNTLDNRTGIVSGTTVNATLLACTAEYIGASSSTPDVVWTRNGIEILTGDSNYKINTDTSGLSSNLEITGFALDNVGEYQCIFVDGDTVIMSKPYRLDTGELKCLCCRSLCDNFFYSCLDIMFEGRSTVFLEGVSPEVIFLRPPEKLVIEMKATGRYRNVRWNKNGLPVTFTEANFANHLEIYVRDPTTTDDLTLYEVSLRAADILSQRNVPSELDFSVTPPGEIFK